MLICRSLRRLKEIVKKRKADRVVLVTSVKLKKKVGWAVEKMERLALPGMKIITIPDGEKAKDWDILKKLLARFARLQLTKKSIVIALGGGTVSDLVGFACSIYKRAAVSYVNIPTTLLAQVDASIGGKTAIDFGGYKNLIGSFYNPIATFLVAGFLESLGGEQFLDGLAEIIKAGLIKDVAILDVLESGSADELRENSLLLGKLILRAIAVKEYFVRKDPKDNGVRQALNLGHTIGHALELKYNLSHGRAVLLGTKMEFQALAQLGMNTSSAMARLNRISERLGIDLDTRQFVVDRRFLLQDKKIAGQKIALPVVRKPGRVRLTTIKLGKLMVAI